MTFSSRASTHPEKDDAIEYLDAALSSLPCGFSVWDDDFRLILANQRYLDIYRLPADKVHRGMPLEDMVGLIVASGNHPGASVADLLPAYRERLLQARDPAKPRVDERSIRGRTIETTHTRHPVLGWIVTHEDVTDRRQREAALRQRNLQLDAALDSMLYGFSLWGKDLKLVLCNRRFVELLGLDPAADWIGASLFEVLLGSTEAGNHQGRSASELHELYLTRLAAVSGDGSFVTEEVLANGRIVKVGFHQTSDLCWVATYEDVTEQKDQVQALQQRERELAQQNMRFEAAVNHMSQGLCMFDKDRRLIVCNKPYADLYGTAPDLVRPGTRLEDILQDRIDNGLHPKDGAEAYLESRIKLAARQSDTVDVVEMEDGQIISVLHHPMADGGWVSTHQDITDERRTEARIRHLARHDALTDLPNRMAFNECMAMAENRIARGEMVALLFIDLDFYKTVNDIYGHAIGDAVLVRVASRLRQSCRQDDVVARLGGDEFAILHGPLRTDKDAAGLAARLVALMAEPMLIDGHEVVIGASIGIATAPTDGQTASTLMKNADLALYQAKEDGRGAYRVFEPSLGAAAQLRMAFEMDLRLALTAGQLEVVFQPLLSLDDQRICSLEALLRWNHPTRGVVMPNDILPVAEKTGLIVPIGQWVLNKACSEAAKWADTVRIAVNLSPAQFRFRDLPRQVAGALAMSGIAPDRLELEVSEAALRDNPTAMETLRQLRQIGVRLALDDLGTGDSALQFLRNFRFDKLKIDRSFVKDILSRPDSMVIVSGFIELAKSLEMETTAAGVETIDQLDLMRRKGCSEIQGFLFSPPLPANAVATFFAETGSGEDRQPTRLNAS